MNRTFSFAIFMVTMLSFHNLTAQVNENDPLNSVRHLISEDEIILLWNQTYEPGNTRQKNATFLDFVPGPANTNLNNLGTSTDFGTFFGTYGTGSMDVTTGFFFGSNPGSTEGTVQCWRGQDGVSDNKVVLEVGDPTLAFSGTLDYPRSTVFALKNLMPSSSSIFPQVRVVAGNFNTDNNDEIILVYQADDGALAMEHYEPSKPCPTCEPEITLVATQTGPAFSSMGNPIKTAMFDLAAGDVDADGYDELILTHIKAGTNTLAVSIYDINNFGAMMLKTSKDVFDADFTHVTQTVGATAGDYNAAFAGDEFAIACRWGITSGIGNPNDPDTRLYTLRLQQSGTPEIIVDAANTNHYFSTTQFNQTDGVMCLGLASGDLDGDLNEDIVLNVGPQLWMFKVTETNDTNAYMIPEQLGAFSHNLQVFQDEGRYSNNILAVGNVDDLNGNFGYDFRSEILLGRNRILPDDASNNKQQGFFLNVYGFNSDPGNPGQINFNTAVLRNQIENIHNINDESDIRRYALALGDFNGGSVAKVNIGTLQIVKTIPVGKGPEKMRLQGTNVLVANSGGFGLDSTVSIINTVDDTETSRPYAGGYNPASVSSFKNTSGNVLTYALCRGDFASSSSTAGWLGDLNNGGAGFATSTGADDLCTSPESDKMYFIGSGAVWSVNQFAVSKLYDQNAYGMACDPFTGNLYIADAKDFSSNGEIVIYGANGGKIATFEAGISPNEVVFR